MRKLLMFVALVLGMVSCQNYLDDIDVNVGGEKEVVVSVALPEGTRANSAVGAISNEVVESDEYTLRYIFQIWDEAKQQKKDAVVEYSDDTTISFPVRLVPGRNYRFVVWADVVREDKKEDLHYNTSNFPTISLNTDSWVAMDETRDAYTASELITDFGSAQNYTLTLKRPFAKLRVITTDIAEAMKVTPTTATVAYTTEHYNTFNALESKAVKESKTESKTHENYTIKEYELTNGKVLFTDYFFAENDAVSFNLSVNMSDNGEPITRNFNTDIPVNRNHLTTLIGNILTEGDNIEVRIEEGFDGEIEEVYPPASIDPNRVIRYTATEKINKTWATNPFGANIISHTFSNGEGVIVFDGDVTEIGEIAFNNCDELVSIHIPDSVTAIGAWAFYNCDSLTSVIIPDSVTTIGYAAFEYCDSLTSVTIPDSVTTIEDYTFYCCISLTSVTIPDSVTTIGKVAFYGCSSLTNVTIPDSVTTIGYAAFVLCSDLREFNGKYASEDGRCLIIDGTLNSFAPAGLTEYTIPNSVTTIGNAAIRGCSGLTSVTIPDSVTTIRDLAFAYCDSLTSVAISDSVTTIGGLAFAYCSNFENIYLYTSTPPTLESSAFMDCSDNLKIYVPSQSLDAYKSAEGWREYADKIFGCPPANEIWYTNGSTTEPTLPYNEGAFDANIISNSYDDSKGCWVITFDNAISKVGGYAFYNTNLTGMVIPEGVQTIGSTAFFGCMNLPTITLPRTLITIDEDAFNDSGLATITIPENVEYIGTWAFAFCDNLKEVFCKATTPPTLVAAPFLQCPSNLQIYVPTESYWDYVYADGWSNYKDHIVAYDFENNCIVATPAQTKPTRNEIWYTSLNEEVIEPNNTSAFEANIVSNTYENGKGVIEFDGDVTSIGVSAFAGCNSLTSVTIPNSVTSIEYGAFSHCASLKSIALPDNLTTISTCTFDGCSSLESIIIPEAVTEIGVYAFCECVSLESVVIGSRVTSIRGSAFILCDNLKSVYISDMSAWCKIEFGYWSHSNPLKNGAKLYLNNIEVTELTIPSDITEISDYTFEGCISLTSLTIPDSVTSIGEGAFALCDNLKSVTLGNCVASIEKWAFDGCDSLESITIPDSVTSIGQYAFLSCISLNSVYCKPTTPPTLVDSFDNNAYGRIIYVPYQSVDAYKTASSWSNYANSIEGYDFQ